LAEFKDIQAQMKAEMQNNAASENNRHLKSSADNMAKAAQNLQMTSMSQNQQTASITRAIQAQQQSLQSLSISISNLTNSLNMRAGIGGVQPPPAMAQPHFPQPQPLMMPQGLMTAGSAFGQAGAQFGRTTLGHARDSAIGALGSSSAYLGQFGGISPNMGLPGIVNSGSMGYLPSAFHSMGFMHNPANTLNYTFGAQQAGLARSRGIGAAGTITRGMTAGLNLAGSLGSDHIAGGIGQALLPIPGVGYIAGQMLLGPHMPNPLSPITDELGRISAFGGAAARNSASFLRGGGGGYRAGEFSIGQEGAIGRQVARDTYMDLTYTTSDITELQRGFSGSGHMFGVSTARDYSKRLRELMEEHKVVAKTLQMANSEAVEFMRSMNFESGVDSSKNIGKVYAASHLAGMSPGQVARAMASGARGFAGQGQMAGTGALTAISSLMTSGAMMRSGVDPGLLATVGGEGGIRSIMQNAMSSFYGGPGGMMALHSMPGTGGGMAQRMNRSAAALGDIDSLLNFVANPGQLMEKMTKERGAMSNQADMVADIYRMAKELFPNATGAKLRNAMKISAINLGYAKDEASAEILIQSIPEIKSAVASANRLRNQANTDMMKDMVVEHHSFKAMVKRTARDVMRGVGMPQAAESISRHAADFGSYVEGAYRNLSNRFMGVNEFYLGKGNMEFLKKASKGQIDTSKYGFGPYGGMAGLDQEGMAIAFEGAFNNPYINGQGQGDLGRFLDRHGGAMSMALPGLGIGMQASEYFRDRGGGMSSVAGRLNKVLGARDTQQMNIFGKQGAENIAVMAMSLLENDPNEFNRFVNMKQSSQQDYIVKKMSAGGSGFNPFSDKLIDTDVGKKARQVSAAIRRSPELQALLTGGDPSSINQLVESLDRFDNISGEGKPLEYVSQEDRAKKMRDYLGVSYGEVDNAKLIEITGRPAFKNLIDKAKEYADILRSSAGKNPEAQRNKRLELQKAIKALGTTGDSKAIAKAVLAKLGLNYETETEMVIVSEDFNRKGEDKKLVANTNYDEVNKILDQGKFSAERDTLAQGLQQGAQSVLQNAGLGHLMGGFDFKSDPSGTITGLAANLLENRKNIKGDSYAARSLRKIFGDGEFTDAEGRELEKLFFESASEGRGVYGATSAKFIGEQASKELQEVLVTQTQILQQIVSDIGAAGGAKQ